MAFTKEQQEAIEYSGKNLLVAAAAGSGKTSVLVERIIRRILVDNIDVDKLLIVTFTKAAAGEMRERIYSSIQAKLQDNIDTTRLLQQQALLSKSYIMTIDAFCQSVIRSNFIESGIDSSYRVADESEMLLIKEEVIEDVLEKWYKKKDPYFYNLVETYGSNKTDENLKKTVLELHSFIQSFPWPIEWLNEQKIKLNPKRYTDFGETEWGKDALNYLIITLEGILSESKRIAILAEEYNISGYVDTLNNDFHMLSDIYNNCKDASWNDAFDILNSVSFSKLSPVKKGEDKEQAEKLKKSRDNIKKSINDLIKEIFGGYKQAAMEDLELMHKDLRRVINLVKYFHLKLQKEKKERKVLDFPDMEHLALDVLAKRQGDCIIPTEVALKLREQFEEIYIDEYQDTNLTQETILNVIARDNNKFHVGDVKQSIYSFRQARPDLFINKYHDYDINTEKNKLIKLYKNFRSRKDIVGSVNYIFNRIMNEMTAEMDYTESEYLNFGAEYYDDNFNSVCELLLASGLKGEKSKDITVIEAQLTVNRIKKLFEESFCVYDKQEGGMRKIQFKDIVILMRSVSDKADVYRQVFAKEGIPLYYEGRGGFFASLEISVVLAFLNIIDNPLQDIPLLTVLRSPMFDFSDTELALIRLHKKDVLYYEALTDYEENGNAESLRNKINGFIKLLKDFRIKSSIFTTAELIWEIITVTGYYTYVGLCKEGEKKQANLRLLFEKAASYDSGSNKGIFRFLNYIENLKKKDGDMAEASAISEGMDVVRIMSIHKSKGLEFPVVFLSNTSQNFSKSDVTVRLVKHKTLGIGASCYDKNRKIIYPSVIKKIIGRRIIADSKAEEMRILYVGLTRAREKLIVTGCIKDESESYIEEMKMKCDYENHYPVNYSIIEANCILDWISMSLSYHYINGKKDKNTLCNWAFRYLTKEDIYDECLPSNIISSENLEVDNEIYLDNNSDKQVSDILSWVYPYTNLSSVPSKLSVSDVKRYAEDSFEDGYSLINKEVSLNELPVFMDTKPSEISAALKGTLLHACIQQLDFKYLKGIRDKNTVKDYVKNLINYMCIKGFMTSLQAQSINQSLIVNFVLSSFASRIMESDNYYREVPFTIVKDWGSIYDNDVHKNEPVAIQGIIDCYFEEEGNIVVVDFKSDYISNDSNCFIVAEKYRIQINLYREALKKITGKDVNEAFIYFLRNGDIVKM